MKFTKICLFMMFLSAAQSIVSGRAAAAPAARMGRVNVSLPAAAGDLVTVVYSARLDNGRVVVPARGAGQQEMVLAGKQAGFPMLGQTVIGMKKGAVKSLTVPPAQGFGNRDPGRIKTFPLRQEISPTEQMPIDEVKTRFGQQPKPGLEVRILPFFKSRITKINGKTVTFRHLAKNGSEIKTPIGKTSVTLVKGKIVLVLRPEIGAPFFQQGKRGVISGADEKGFTVDFNNPLAGKTITLKLKVIKIRQKALLAAVGPITWQKDLKTGRAQAKNRHKPLFLLLYADWCPWCKKLKSEVLTDVRLRMLRDDFVWVELNSGKEKRYQKEFRQNGFPLIVLLDENGQPVARIDGFKNAAFLSRGLLGWLQSRPQG